MDAATLELKMYPAPFSVGFLFLEHEDKENDQ